MNKLISVVQYNKFADHSLKYTFAKLVSSLRVRNNLDRIRYNGQTYVGAFSNIKSFVKLTEANKFSIEVIYE